MSLFLSSASMKADASSLRRSRNRDRPGDREQLLSQLRFPKMTPERVSRIAISWIDRKMAGQFRRT
jgi:hypothetical protein